MTDTTPIGLLGYGPALPSLRLPASAYKEAWGGCAARGLVRKAFCAYDEDAVTLAVASARLALRRARVDAAALDAVFLGATTLPYEEKPAAASLLNALTSRRDVRVVEMGGSPQAGLQALAAAWDFCAARPGRVALAVAADAPSAPADAPYEHALGAGAAAFVVGAGGPVATLTNCFAVSRETFGGRMRRRGDDGIRDLELRTDDVGPVFDDLARAFKDAPLPARLAFGGDGAAARRAPKVFGVEANAVVAPWSVIGDCGAALAPLALCEALDQASPKEALAAVALGAGAIAITLSTGPAVSHAGPTMADLAAAGREVGYMEYLRHRRMLSSRFGGTA